MKYYCPNCCIEFSINDEKFNGECPNCGSTIIQETKKYTLATTVADTIWNYENLIDFIENEVYPYIQELYKPKYSQYDIDKVKFVYSNNFVPKPMFRLKLVHNQMIHKHKHFDILACVFDGDWKEYLKKEYQANIEADLKDMEKYSKAKQQEIKDEATSVKIAAHRTLMFLVEKFKKFPLTKEEQSYLSEIPNKETIKAIKELEGID